MVYLTHLRLMTNDLLRYLPDWTRGRLVALFAFAYRRKPHESRNFFRQHWARPGVKGIERRPGSRVFIGCPNGDKRQTTHDVGGLRDLGKRAISLQPYLTKGMRVCVSGPVKFEEYQTKEGATRFRLRITVDQLDMPPKQVSEAVPQVQSQQAAAPAKPPAHLADMTDVPF